MTQTGSRVISFVVVSSNEDIVEFATHGDVTNEKSLHLGGSGDGNSHSNTCHVDSGVDYLHLEGRLTAEYFIGGNLESVDKSCSSDGSIEVRSEGQQYVDIFSCNASSQGSRVYLIVAGFNVVFIFSEEGEGDFSPRSVFPLGSDDEWDDLVTV